MQDGTRSTGVHWEGCKWMALLFSNSLMVKAEPLSHSALSISVPGCNMFLLLASGRTDALLLAAACPQVSQG